jgi:Fe-S-cluster containining protein
MSKTDPVSPSRDVPEEKLTIPVDIPTLYGRFQAVLVFSAREIRLSEFALEVSRRFDQIMTMMLTAKAIPNQSISCSKGCGACCRQAVSISPPEALMLADHVASFSPDRRETLKRRFASAQSRFAASGLKDTAVSLIEKRSEVFSFGINYFKQGIPCPFLEDESCSIYSHRPIDCRNYLATSRASLCSTVHLDDSPVKVLKVKLPFSYALSMLTAEILKGAPEVHLVINALEWSDANSGLGDRKFDTVQLLGRFLELMKSDSPAPPASISEKT